MMVLALCGAGDELDNHFVPTALKLHGKLYRNLRSKARSILFFRTRHLRNV
jgi:hypothetical protein